MLLVCYPKCSTCAKAEKWLAEKGVSYDYRDIKLNNPKIEELEKWYGDSGLDIKKFFNTSGLLYKDLKLKDKLPQMATEEKLALLSSDGMLVKRPILIGDDFVLVGFKEKDWAEKLGIEI